MKLSPKMVMALAVLMLVAGHVTVGSAATEIEFACVWQPGSAYGDMLKFIIDEFTARNPDIQVMMTGGQSLEKFMVRVAGNAPPDVQSLGDSQVFDAIVAGTAIPVSQYAKADGVSGSDFWQPAWARVDQWGEIWGLPWSVDVNFPMAYNARLFQEAGLDTSSFPRVVEEVDALSRKLDKVTPDGIPKVLGIIPWLIAGGTKNAIMTWGWAFDGSFYDSVTRQVTPAHHDVVATLEWLERHNHVVSRASIQGAMGSDAMRLFGDEKVAMMPLVAAWAPSLRAGFPQLDMSWGPFPVKSGFSREGPYWVGGHSLVIPRGAQHPKEAWRLMRFIAASPEGTRLLAKRDAVFPAYRRAPAFADLMRDRDAAPYIEALRKASIHRADIPMVTQYVLLLGEAVDSVLALKQAPRPALEDVKRRIQPKIDEFLTELKHR